MADAEKPLLEPAPAPAVILLEDEEVAMPDEPKPNGPAPKPAKPKPFLDQPAVGLVIVTASIFSPVIVGVGLYWLFTRKRKGR